MSRQKTQHTKQFKLDAINYRKEHPDLTQVECAKNLGILILISLFLRYPCIISRIAAFCGESLFLLAIIKTSKLSNVILHQFEGLHKLWDTPLPPAIFYILFMQQLRIIISSFCCCIPFP